MYYKNVRRLPDGRRVSQFIDEQDYHYNMLEYKPNGITKAPGNSHGVFCYDSLHHAKNLVNGNTFNGFTGIVEVHIAYPIGKPEVTCFDNTFPAIKLGKTVGRYKVVKGYRRSYKGIHSV